MFDGASRLIIDNADELDERRASAYVQRLRDLRRRQPGADALSSMLDFKPARSSSSKSGRKASSCLVKVKATPSGTWVVR